MSSSLSVFLFTASPTTASTVWPSKHHHCRLSQACRMSVENHVQPTWNTCRMKSNLKEFIFLTLLSESEYAMQVYDLCWYQGYFWFYVSSCVAPPAWMREEGCCSVCCIQIHHFVVQFPQFTSCYSLHDPALWWQVFIRVSFDITTDVLINCIKHPYCLIVYIYS